MRWLSFLLISLAYGPAAFAQSDLYWAVANNDARQAWVLTNPDLPPAAWADEGSRPEFWAVERGASEVLDVLTWRGVALTGVDAQGASLLFPAAALGRLDLFQKVLEGGANLAQRDVRGRSVVHAAAPSPHPEMLKALMVLGLDPQDRTTLGVTPLMVACGAGNRAEADLLLRWGAVPEDLDYLGRSVRDYAAASGSPETLARIDEVLTPPSTEPDGEAPPP